MRSLFQGSRGILDISIDDAELTESLVLAAYRQLFAQLVSKLPPCSFANGILFLAAPDASWKNEGAANRGKIIEAINQTLAKNIVTSIGWKPWNKRLVECKTTQPDAKPLPEHLIILTEKIEDPKMRTAMAKLLNSFYCHGKLDISQD